MTLTTDDLREFRRREKEIATLTSPPANFLTEIKTLLDQIKEEAGPDPITWSEDADIHAAMDLLEDIFRIRRNKLVRVAELNPSDNTPMPAQLFEWESCAWFGLTTTYRHLDKVIRDICLKGEWSGKWGELPEKARPIIAKRGEKKAGN